MQHPDFFYQLSDEEVQDHEYIPLISAEDEEKEQGKQWGHE